MRLPVQNKISLCFHWNFRITLEGPFRTGDNFLANFVLQVRMDCPDMTIFGRDGQFFKAPRTNFVPGKNSTKIGQMKKWRVVAKTRGRAGPGSGSGSGCLFSFPFFFASIFVVIFLYCCFRMTGICPSFMVEISKNIKELTEATKVLKGHLDFFLCLF